MKVIKFKQKRSYSYKRKVLVKDLVLKMLVGIHNFEKKKKQRVKFNLVINIDQNLKIDLRGSIFYRIPVIILFIFDV